MAFTIVLLLVAALVIFGVIRRAKARQRTLMANVQGAIQGTSGAPVTVKQGNVTVRMKTSVSTENVRFGSAADEIAKALAGISPAQLQAQAEAALTAMRNSGSTQLSPNQTEAIEAALRNSFGAGATVIFDSQSPEIAETADFSSASDPEPVLFSPTPAFPTPAPAADSTNGDPFSPGNVFERHQKAADASFNSSSEADREPPKNRDPFG